ncbi:MAG: lysophospholipid acyltransferase family protein [Gemmatimonadota bacterium]
MRTAFAWTIGFAYTLFWATLGILTWPFSPRGDLYLRFARIWSRWILASLQIPWTVTGRDRLDPNATYLFMANHQSVFDIFALFVALEHPLRMIAKRVIFAIPILGCSLWMCGFIPINRADRGQAIASLERAARRMGAGLSILVFPEGTRGRGGRLAPFKKGGFALALTAGVPIVPVAVVGTDRIMPSGSRRIGRGRISIHIGAPIPVAGRTPTDRDGLMAEVRAALEQLRAMPVAAGREVG